MLKGQALMTVANADVWHSDEIAPVIGELLDRSAPTAFQGLTRLAAALLEAPVALISIIDESCDRQVFASQLGLSASWAKRGETPLSHSFCQYVKTRNAPLVVPDARCDPQVRDNLAIRDLGVVAYLGMPIHDPKGNPLGAICVIDKTPRNWSQRDQELLQDLAVCVSDEILLRASALRQETMHQGLQIAHDRLRRYTALTELVAQPALAPGLAPKERLQEVLRNMASGLGYEAGTLAMVDPKDPERARIIARVGSFGLQSAQTVVRLRNTLAARVLSSGSILCCDAGQTEDPCLTLIGAPVHDYAAVPLLGSQDRAIGVIELTGPRLRATPLDDNERTVLALASMFAGTLVEFGLPQATPHAAPVASLPDDLVVICA